MVKHNKIIPNQHFHKKWASSSRGPLKVKVNLDQPGKKKARRLKRAAKAAVNAPRPADRLRPLVRCQTQQHNAKAAVSAMAFAPDGTTLAVGSADMVVYLHAANDGFQLFSIFAEHSSPIRALDFSADAKYVRSACGARELKFFQALDGAKVENLDLVKDADWASETSPKIGRASCRERV